MVCASKSNLKLDRSSRSWKFLFSITGRVCLFKNFARKMIKSKIVLAR